MASFAKKAGSTSTKGPDSENKKKKKEDKKASAKEEPMTPKKTKKATSTKKSAEPTAPVQHKLYTLKFNSPILPFAKFPLTQNKFI